MYKDNKEFENRHLSKTADNIYKDINVTKSKIVNFTKKYYKSITINEINVGNVPYFVYLGSRNSAEEDSMTGLKLE